MNVHGDGSCPPTQGPGWADQVPLGERQGWRGWGLGSWSLPVSGWETRQAWKMGIVMRILEAWGEDYMRRHVRAECRAWRSTSRR